MAGTKHTPGPWRVATRPEYDADYITADRMVGGPTGRDEYDREMGVFAVVDDEPETVCRPDLEADARLIAAAPDLLAACRDAYALTQRVACATPEAWDERQRKAAGLAEKLRQAIEAADPCPF